jgi:hypothetical protein
LTDGFFYALKLELVTEDPLRIEGSV